MSEEKRLYPLASVQEEILYFEKEYPGTSVCNICFTMRPLFNYSRAEVAEALGVIVEHSQALRLQFCETEDGFCQYEVPFAGFEPEWHADKSRTGAELVEEYSDIFTTPFELIDNPLYRILALEGSDGITVLCCIHHLVLDGWAAKNFIWQYMYNCINIHEGRPLTFYDCNYFDFVEYEAKLKQSARYAKDCAYWQERFAEFEGPALLLPGSPNYEKEPSIAAKRLTRVVPKEDMDAMKQFCADNGISSPSIILKGAILLYLHRRNPDHGRVDMGEMILNRRKAAEKFALGNYASEIIIGVSVDDSKTGPEFLKEVQQTSNMAYRHSHYLHDDILEYVQERNPECEAIRDIEFGYFPDVKENDNLFLEPGFKFNGTADTTAECILYDIYAETVLLIDYQLHMMTEEEALLLQENLLHLALSLVRSPEQALSGLQLKTSL